MQVDDLFANFYISRQREVHLCRLHETRVFHEIKEDFLTRVPHLHGDSNHNTWIGFGESCQNVDQCWAVDEGQINVVSVNLSKTP